MEKLRGPGLKAESIGMLQVADTVIETLINGWWLVTVEDCMTENYGEGYWLELLVNGRKLSLSETGFLTIDDVSDGMFVLNWTDVVMVLGMNANYFKNKAPEHVQEEASKCGYCDSTTYPHICLGSATEMVSTANASAPKPPKVTQVDQDATDMSKAAAQCNCGSNSSNWRHHKQIAAEPNQCVFYKEGKRIQIRERKMLRLFFSGRRS